MKYLELKIHRNVKTETVSLPAEGHRQLACWQRGSWFTLGVWPPAGPPAPVDGPHPCLNEQHNLDSVGLEKERDREKHEIGRGRGRWR